MVHVFQIDKSGKDIFENDYSIALVANKKEIYGINIPLSLKNLLLAQQLSKKERLRLKIRLHTIIIILLIKKAILELKPNELNIQICNYIDGHFHEIKDMTFYHLNKMYPNLKKEDIIQAKFDKKALINKVAKNLRERKLFDYNRLEVNKKEIRQMLRIKRH